MFKLNPTALTAFIFLLFTEIAIATFYKEGFIRHIFGDYLVVLLLYSFLKSFISISNNKLAKFTLFIAFIVEFIQLTPLLEILSLEHHKLANLIFGNTFSIIDLLAYIIGYFTIIIFNIYIPCKHFSPTKIK